MKYFKLLLFSVFIGQLTVLNSQPIALHPTNPHYFLYKGEPEILISSSEHYGAIMNKAFDYATYLETLAKDGLNYARVFTGTYVEKPGDFGIEQNTLAPDSFQLIVPWKRSDVSGYFYGGNKFDLDQWDEAYFDRLKSFIEKASELDIIVELTLFSSLYRGWEYCPFYFNNNINNLDSIPKDSVHTMLHPEILHYQEALVRKMVKELNAYDNLIYEIQNEPYADAKFKAIPLTTYMIDWKDRALQRIDLATEASLVWQKHIAALIVEEEKKLPKKHLVAQNYANFFYPLTEVDENIDIINFHYNYPEASYLNYGFNKPLSFDEAGFAIANDSSIYRRQAWNWILAGGAVYNNLDYSFAVGFEDGTCQNNAPGFGGTIFRKQMGILKNFIESFDYLKLIPDHKTVVIATGAQRRVLSEPGRQYAIYLEGIHNKSDVVLDLPVGKYKAEWVNTKTGSIDKSEKINVANEGHVKLLSPNYVDDIALRIKLE